jgi:multiple sugar transport system permease protein
MRAHADDRKIDDTSPPPAEDRGRLSYLPSGLIRWIRRGQRDEPVEGATTDLFVSVPRRIVTIYLPLLVFLFVLLFPFYWMVITSFKSNAELYDYENFSPFWVVRPTLDHIERLLFRTSYPLWLWNTMLVAAVATFLSLFASVLAAYAIQRLRFKGSSYVGVAIFLAYLVPPSILFIPLAWMVFQYNLFDTRLALILTYPTFLIPFCTWLLMGYFKSIPYELEECALIDGAGRLQILWKIILPLSIPGLISAGIFAFTLSWNEFIYALTFISSSENKTVPVGVLTELVEGDVYHWGSLMAGALLGSLPVAILYSFFVEHYVSSMTGAVKE